MNIVHLDTDLLIIGGGAAGCFAAAEAKALEPGLRCLIMEKAHIQRSGCLAMGLNSINAYINPGESPQSYLDYVRGEFMDLVRDDLVLSIAQGLNEVVRRVEEWGLPIEKLPDGNYKPRGKRAIRVRGERLKPILAQATRRAGVEVLNRVAATNLILSGGRVVGAFGLGVRDGRLYVIRAKGVIVAAGGASGIYKSYNPDSARHLMWYCPWNVGTGYAMGIRAGAEMTSFENRFIALRVKGVQAPTGTLALGAGARQINARGEPYLEKYYKDSPLRKSGTYHRLLSTLLENEAGRGPCYMDLGHLSPSEERQFKEDLLNMSPTLALLWIGRNGSDSRLEISGSEPYIVGGHGEAGYWIDIQRRTTLPGLYAAGDVAGGAPKKYVSGAWVEGKIAARTAQGDIKSVGARCNVPLPPVDAYLIKEEAERVTAPLKRATGVSPQEMEEGLQGLMDRYAGGFSTHYVTNEEWLLRARESLRRLQDQADTLKAQDYHELVSCLEVMDRIDVARVVVEHLLFRRETRWPCSQSRRDYPQRDDARWLKFVNSVMDPSTGEIRVMERELKHY
jgi:adenylylsulfate reductase subunit A